MGGIGLDLESRRAGRRIQRDADNGQPFVVADLDRVAESIKSKVDEVLANYGREWVNEKKEKAKAAAESEKDFDIVLEDLEESLS